MHRCLISERTFAVDAVHPMQKVVMYLTWSNICARRLIMRSVLSCVWRHSCVRKLLFFFICRNAPGQVCSSSLPDFQRGSSLILNMECASRQNSASVPLTTEPSYNQGIKVCFHGLEYSLAAVPSCLDVGPFYSWMNAFASCNESGTFLRLHPCVISKLDSLSQWQGLRLAVALYPRLGRRK